MNQRRELAIKTPSEDSEMSQSLSQPTEDDVKDELELEDLSATTFFEVIACVKHFSGSLSLGCCPTNPILTKSFFLCLHKVRTMFFQLLCPQTKFFQFILRICL